jgi:hypothetical protein
LDPDGFVVETRAAALRDRALLSTLEGLIPKR